jgi:D-sedoheptulose 7-phosphate isomerase
MEVSFVEDLNEHNLLASKISCLNEVVSSAVLAVTSALQSGGKLLLCGNGGSAADCQHIAAEFTGRFIKDRRPLAAVSFTTDTSALTCISNDYSFDDVFSRQVMALGSKGDCLIGISTSGNSANVYNAVCSAKEKSIVTIGLLGKDGGRLAGLCDISIIVPSVTTARIQEMHILIGHSICRSVEINLGFN